MDRIKICGSDDVARMLVDKYKALLEKGKHFNGDNVMVIVIRDASLYMDRILSSAISYVIVPPYNGFITCMYGVHN